MLLLRPRSRARQTGLAASATVRTRRDGRVGVAENRLHKLEKPGPVETTERMTSAPLAELLVPGLSERSRQPRGLSGFAEKGAVTAEPILPVQVPRGVSGPNGCPPQPCGTPHGT